jgi:LacI family transcriptional regulator
MAEGKLTIRQIAELAGVSRSTASRVLNGQPGVRPEVRDRVLQIIREHGYHPNGVARSLASRRSTAAKAEGRAQYPESGPTHSV